MFAMLVHPRCQVVPPVASATKKMMTTYKSVLNFHPWTNKARRILGDRLATIHIGKAGQQTPGLLGDNKDGQEDQGASKTVEQIKEELFEAVEGINRGIFGVPARKKTEIHAMVELLESQNPTLNPTQSLEKVDGCWKLVYSTISILGSKRTKLGLRDFITLGELFQKIDVAKGKAINVIKFNVRGFSLFSGQFTIEASFKPASESRVDIKYESSIITPDQLLNMLKKNYDILLGIFNPDGWLEITYVDDDLRMGRDDKDNIFVLKRSEEG